jgi:hypothetical protein
VEHSYLQLRLREAGLKKRNDLIGQRPYDRGKNYRSDYIIRKMYDCDAFRVGIRAYRRDERRHA